MMVELVDVGRGGLSGSVSAVAELGVACDPIWRMGYAIALIRWLQNKVVTDCKDNYSVECILSSLEEALTRLEDKAAEHVTEDLLGYLA